MKKIIKKIIQKAIASLVKETPDFSIEVPSDKNNGDYSTNIALILSKKLGKNPIETANLIKEKIGKNDIFAKIEVVNGFINFFISEKYLQEQLQVILNEKINLAVQDLARVKKLT